MKRRITYYKLLLQRSEDEVTRKVVMAQKENILPGDFYIQVRENMATLSITESDLLLNSEETLKQILDDKISKAAFSYLLTRADKHSKTRNSLYSNMNGCSYLKNPRFTTDISRLLFMLQTRTYGVKNNFRNHYKNEDLWCPLCSGEGENLEKQIDNQEHLFECTVLVGSPDNLPCVYEDIFSENLETLLIAGQVSQEILLTRDILLDN